MDESELARTKTKGLAKKSESDEGSSDKDDCGDKSTHCNSAMVGTESTPGSKRTAGKRNRIEASVYEMSPASVAATSC